jgi:hypothetical protein
LRLAPFLFQLGGSNGFRFNKSMPSFTMQTEAFEKQAQRELPKA